MATLIALMGKMKLGVFVNLGSIFVVLKVPKEIRVFRVFLDSVVQEESLEPKEKQELRVPEDQEVPLVLWVLKDNKDPR